MAFYNGSNATINGIAGSGPASDVADFLTKVRTFLTANGWTVTNVENISGGQADLVFESTGFGADESVVLRVQDGTVTNSLSPLDTNVDADRIRVTAAPFFDASGQKVYNEVGSSKAEVELPIDDDASFNFWVFTDSDATHAIFVTQISGAYNVLVAGRLQRQVSTDLAKTAVSVSITTPGTPEAKVISLDRTRPSSWVQGKVLCVHSLAVADNSGNGGDISAQELPVEFGVVGDLSGLNADEVRLTVSRNYAAGALIGQDPLPIAVLLNSIGSAEVLAMSYDNGGAQNSLGYTAPNGQLASVGVAELYGFDVGNVLGAQDPDDYQGDQIILPLFSFDSSASRVFALRHQIPNVGRISTANGPLDELVLPTGDRWLAFTVGSDRVAVGKVN